MDDVAGADDALDALGYEDEPPGVVEADGTATCLLGVRNARGHDLGVIGLSLAAGVSPARLAALRAEIAEAVAGQDNESILLTL